MVEPDRPQMTI